jgi:hypothetical protein
LGFFLCAASVAAAQAAIGGCLEPGGGVPDDVGYAFTGLTAGLGYALWRWGRAGAAEQTVARVWLTRLLQASVAALPALIGCLYFGMAGTERHARAFAALPPLMYLLAAGRHLLRRTRPAAHS